MEKKRKKMTKKCKKMQKKCAYYFPSGRAIPPSKKIKGHP